MRIRATTEADAPTAAALWTEAYTSQDPVEGRRDPYDEADLAAVMRSATVLVAELEPGVPIGIVALVPAARPLGAVARAGEAELSRLAIAAAARRRGLGRALAERAIELARVETAQGVALWSRPYQLAAHSLYESLGFRRAPDRDGRDRLGRRWVFTLELATRR